MDFIDILKQFAVRTNKLKNSIQTEEATKTSLVMPFFQQVFGYDIFNPDEFVPEFTADVGIKKGEKVDYAILLEGTPVMLIEVKWCGLSLDKHDSQLFRYFGTTNAKYGILTNGVIYRFYTDLEEQNKMDLKPFLEVNLSNLKDVVVPELKQFCKDNFDTEQIFARASELKYSNDIRTYFLEQLNEPSDDFVRYMLGCTYEGTRTQAIVEKFRPIVKSTLNNLISEMMNEKITTALKTDAATSTPSATAEPRPEDQSAAGLGTSDTGGADVSVGSSQNDDVENRLVITEEEIHAYYLVKSILQNSGIDVSRISYRDNRTYFVIIADDSSFKWICRLRLGNFKKSISLPSDDKREIKHDLNSVDDIFNFKDEIIASANQLFS